MKISEERKAVEVIFLVFLLFRLILDLDHRPPQQANICPRSSSA